MMETSASARPNLRRPIPFTVVTAGKGLCAAAPSSFACAERLRPARLFHPASATAACLRKLRRSILDPPRKFSCMPLEWPAPAFRPRCATEILLGIDSRPERTHLMTIAELLLQDYDVKISNTRRPLE